jgi:hypothetical protein
MKSLERLLGVVVVLAVMALVLAPAAFGRPLDNRDGFELPVTAGAKYDRNPTIVVDRSTAWMFFARSQNDCNRLQGCNADVELYDLTYVRCSLDDGGCSPPTTLMTNPTPTQGGTFYGRTVAATRTADGTIHVFWASGGNSSGLYHFSKPAGATAFTADPPVFDSTHQFLYFNVEAVARGNTVYVFSEACCTAPGIYVQTFQSGVYSAPSLVQAGLSIPKVIVDRRGVFRLTAVDANDWPNVHVLTSSSVDGTTWGAFSIVIVGAEGVSNWDPSLVQTSDGRFHLYWAPDLGDGRQRIEMASSRDFAHWSPAQVVTEGTDGQTAIWEYWPEAVAAGAKTVLFYTSERATQQTPTGVGHIWMRFQR